MDKEHFLYVNNLISYRILDHKSFKTMSMYLLYSATYSQVPLSSVIDTRIKEQLEKSGSARNIAFWNWTPLQKSLLDADVPKLIMTSHWSTGKTRILFEKALMLAREGKLVLFILHYSNLTEEQSTDEDYFGDYAPILLYHSLMNEISNEEDQTKSNFHLMATNDLQTDILNSERLQNNDVHIFIDEFVVHSDGDLKMLDEISTKIGQNNYFWLSVAKSTSQSTKSFKTWLEGKVKDGYLEPNLKYPLRNTKEIVEFENSLAPKESRVDELITTTANLEVSTTNLETLENESPGAESLPLPSKEEPSSSRTLVQPYNLPTQNLQLSLQLNFW